ncbi:phosphatase PAP2 family protein [Pedobacter sp. MW01-1-1]|uniref:phosphatase PAP2 family protein n=1 Tax=Pedobacter sp. MW01-1-1 TaxID=3383027 RepID=UPI003FF064CE
MPKAIFLKKNLLLTIFFVLLSAFIFLSYFISQNPLLPFDINTSLFFQKYQSNFLDKLMLVVSFFGELPYSFIMIFGVVVLFYLKKYKREALYIASIALSGLVILGVKNWVNRPRPTAFNVRIVEINRFQSYPSGHVLSYVLFFGFLLILMNTLSGVPNWTRKTVSYLSTFYIIAIPYSRIYLGAHWFTDTVGGFLLGLICLIPLVYFYFKGQAKEIK